MSRRLEWNPEHKNADQQQNAFVDRYLSWSPIEKWEYLMELIAQGVPKNTTDKAERKIEWK